MGIHLPWLYRQLLYALYLLPWAAVLFPSGKAGLFICHCYAKHLKHMIQFWLPQTKGGGGHALLFSGDPQLCTPLQNWFNSMKSKFLWFYAEKKLIQVWLNLQDLR